MKKTRNPFAIAGTILVIIIVIYGMILIFKQRLECWPYYQVAIQIPRYKNVDIWEIDTSRSDMFASGPCGGTIYFRTNEDIESVFDFYKTNLIRKGWKILLEGNTKNIFGDTLRDKVITFTKNNLSIGLTSRTMDEIPVKIKGEYPNYFFIIAIK